MSDHATRRSFLGKATAAGACLAVRGLGSVVRAAQPAQRQPESSVLDVTGVVDAATKTTLGVPVTVVTQTLSSDVNPRAATWIYIIEILQRAGLCFEQLSPADLPSLLGRSNPIVLLAGDLQLTSAQREALTTVVENGGSLIGLGGTSGLDKIFGIDGKRPLTEGWITVTAQNHPITSGLRSSLHVFGGHAVTSDSSTPLAKMESGRQGAKGSAIVENRFGKGRAVLLAPDLLFSIVHIQQGVAVLQDSKPSTDNSAPTDDGELKAEDGIVLNWRRDRTPMQPDGVPVFLEPITDELREIILRSIFHVASLQGITLPMLWYWPRDLKAIGHISHDSDGNDLEKAMALLEVLNHCKVKSTWCMLFPGGYPRGFYDTLKKQGFEIALHYDARSRDEQTSWSKKNLVFQRDWLMKEAGLEQITSNKNHYTRWENRLDFLRWCEQIGIHSDQTRGGSKQGTIGFPLGGSQPYFPLDDRAEPPRLLDVLEVNMLTQDLVAKCPKEYGKELLDSALRHHGVAHFLFHPAHILKPGVADALCNLVDYGRAKGLEWWTNEQIYRWEKLRRSVETSFDSASTLILRATEPLREATLLFLRPGTESRSIVVDGQPAQSSPWSLYGFEFDAVTVDVEDEVKVLMNP